jgi:cathepsin L
MTSNLTASKIPPIVTVDGFQKLPVNDYNAVLNAVATIGPMAINIQANVWQHYSEGVFTGCSNLSLHWAQQP